MAQDSAVEETGKIDKIASPPRTPRESEGGHVSMVTFTEHTRVKDVIAWYSNDDDVNEAIIRNLESWDVVDSQTGQPVPRPQEGETDFHLEMIYEDWLQIIDVWNEWRSRKLPKKTE